MQGWQLKYTGKQLPTLQYNCGLSDFHKRATLGSDVLERATQQLHKLTCYIENVFQDSFKAFAYQTFEKCLVGKSRCE